MDGYMHKQGEGNKEMRRRWFQLRGGTVTVRRGAHAYMYLFLHESQRGLGSYAQHTHACTLLTRRCHLRGAQYFQKRGGKKAGSFTVGGARLTLITGAIDESTTGSGRKLIRLELPQRTYVLCAESDTQVHTH
jgi:hypothetical protein